MSKESKYAILDLGGEELYIEVEDITRAGLSDYSDNSLGQGICDEEDKPVRLSEENLKQLVRMGGKLFEHFKEFKADEIQIDFSIKIDAETKVLCFAKTEFSGQFGVKLTWKERNNKETAPKEN